MQSKLKVLIYCVAAVLACFRLSAQQTEAYRSTDRPYFEALELMNYEQYESARRMFSDYLESAQNSNTELYANAEYYLASTTMKLFHKDAEYLMETFVHTHPESNWRNPAIYDLANYNFNRRDYDDALYWLDQVDTYKMSVADKEKITFKKGFSAFELEDYELAKASFYELKDGESEYKGPSNYYYGHIAYTEGNYQTALDALEAAQADPNFEPVVPYYITQIYHFQERYDDLIAYAEPMMEMEETVRKEEIAHLLGHAYYQKQEFAKAVPYLRYFMENSSKKTAEDAYPLAYALYRMGEYQESIGYFVKAAKSDDEALVQIATYQMADAYVNLDQKNYAQNAFKVSAQMGIDPEVTEDSYFNYAKLAYELSYDPFHEAIRAFEAYLEKYPNSERKDDAYEFLLKVYISTKNYPAAMASIDKMKTPNPYHRIKYQECAYNLAVGQMRKGKTMESTETFAKVKTYPEDPKLVALSDYWLGDLKYRKGKYDEAKSHYQAFVSSSASFQTDYYNLVQYNLGYCYFKEKDYPSSLTAFRKFISSNQVDDKRKNDAYLRIGDLNLVTKNYKVAIENYAKAVEKHGANEDYALFQMAQCYGYEENYFKKIETLEQLFAKHPETSLAPVSYFELGESYFAQNELNPALSNYNTVVDSFPQSPYRKKSLLKRGLVLYRLNNYDDAIASFKTVVNDYGVDSESNEAIATLKNIYLDLGDVDAYSKWLADIPDYEVSRDEIDSLSYQAAENLVADADCDGAIKAFNKYLSDYPNGLFALNAYYYIADCSYRKNDFNTALTGFTYVIDQPTSQFSESSLLGAATIQYDRKNYEAALPLYVRLESVASFATNVLEAQIGKMRTAFKIGDYDLALKGADQALANSATPEKIEKEAKLTKARIYFAQKEYDLAKPFYEELSLIDNTTEGAESKYRLAEIAMINQELDLAENHVFELVQNFQAITFWKVKAFILLSDIYVERDDYFQARATLQSVLDNVSDSSLVAIAEDKMEALDTAEEVEIQKADTLASPDTLDYEDSYNELIDEPKSEEE